jgi:hypothetical protein
MAKHMAWSTHGDLLLLAHDVHRPTEDEWRAWLRAYETRSPHVRGVLVRTVGGGPSSSQRKELVQTIQAQTSPPRTAILTSSALVRGLLTAISWFLSGDHLPTMFALDDLAGALAFLNVAPTDGPGVRAELARLAASLEAPARASTGGV